MKKLSDLEKGYMAGIIDGEGSIMISKHKRSNKKHPYYYDLVIRVAQVDKKMLIKLKEIAGGSVGGPYNHKNGKYKGWNNYFVWTLHSTKEIEDLLLQITVHLQTKRKQARLALKYARLPRAKNQFDEKMLSWKRKRQKKMYVQMGLLNGSFRVSKENPVKTGEA